MKDVYIVEGFCICFDVKVIGMFEFDVIWYKDGWLVKVDKYLEFVYDEDIFVLIFMYGKFEDVGDYICKVFNEVGDV